MNSYTGLEIAPTFVDVGYWRGRIGAALWIVWSMRLLPAAFVHLLVHRIACATPDCTHRLVRIRPHYVKSSEAPLAILAKKGL